jgi:hypothetical protein
MSQSKINFNQTTKLNSIDTKPEKMSIIRSGEIAKTKSFRFRPIDKERLNKILLSANESCKTKRFNETDVIRSLLTMGENLSGDKIISYLRKSLI